jgi:hypothetical protein
MLHLLANEDGRPTNTAVMKVLAPDASVAEVAALSGTLDAVLDTCATIEAMCADTVVAAADAHVLPALEALLSSRRWWDGAAACGPARSARALAAVESARGRADARSAVAAVYDAAAAGKKVALHRKTAPPKEAQQEASPPPRDDNAAANVVTTHHAADDATRELIESLLAAQKDLTSRLHVLEKGKARAPSPDPTGSSAPEDDGGDVDDSSGGAGAPRGGGGGGQEAGPSLPFFEPAAG